MDLLQLLLQRDVTSFVESGHFELRFLPHTFDDVDDRVDALPREVPHVADDHFVALSRASEVQNSRAVVLKQYKVIKTLKKVVPDTDELLRRRVVMCLYRLMLCYQLPIAK